VALQDRVDMLSLSLGGTKSFEFDQDPISISAFSVVSKGIVMVYAAGKCGQQDRPHGIVCRQ
jgi:hypothetical protein